MIYFSSDFHFGHKMIIQYSERPFKNVSKMNHSLVTNWNRMVKKDDIGYILGDLTLRRHADHNLMEIVGSMNGRKRLIIGNHDKIKWFEYLDLGFESVHTSYELVYEGHKIFMCHDPAMREAVPKDYIVACGHVHRFFKVFKNCVNVGVDVWNYEPLSIDTLIDKMANFHLEGCDNEETNGLGTNRK